MTPKNSRRPQTNKTTLRANNTYTIDLVKGPHHCGVPGNSILEAVVLVRDAIAHYNTTGTPLCVLSLDFQNAFDRISHQYLFQILQSYGISPWFIEGLRSLYDNAIASVQINGTLAGPIPINSGVRQGCPLSMVLYALCLHPLLRTLEKQLPGIPAGHHTHSVPVVAYVDDVTICVTRPEDFTVILQAVRVYEQATGARLNPKKSKALAIGPWTEPPTALGIEFHEQVTILGVTFASAITKSITDSWSRVLRTARVHPNPMPGSENKIRTPVPTGENMVPNTSTTTNQCARAPTNNSVLMVYLAGGNIQGSRNHTPKPKGTRRLGPSKH